jgi:hypothetical protein
VPAVRAVVEVRMTRAEQETVIRWDREEQAVHIWTADRAVMRKLDRLGGCR